MKVGNGEIIFAVIAVLFVASFIYGMAANPGSEFGGADGAAEGVITDVTGGYEPWVGNMGFVPPGGETESLLFALQAAIGAAVIGCFFGYYKGKGRSD